MGKLNEIIHILGQPYYENSSVLIFNMDCFEGVRKLKKGGLQIDATITSPPYNIGKEYEKVKVIHPLPPQINQRDSNEINACKNYLVPCDTRYCFLYYICIINNN